MKKVEIVNRKAKFEYHFLDSYEAGILLVGTEVKSVRNGEANLTDAYCYFSKGELWVKSLFIGEYKQGNRFNHETRRERKLLLNKRELKKLEKRINEKGLTIVPYRLYFNERNRVKLEIKLAQGKKVYDKRESIKQEDVRRDLERQKIRI
jgi:SsrA-binding protein